MSVEVTNVIVDRVQNLHALVLILAHLHDCFLHSAFYFFQLVTVGETLVRKSVGHGPN